MEKKIKNANNAAHLYGFIENVRPNAVNDEGLVAINLKVSTQENYKVDGEDKTRRTYHDVVIFTKDEKVIKTYEAIQASLDKNHTVSLDGMMNDKENGIQIVCKPENVRPDVKQEKDEVRNSAVLAGNIASIDLYDEMKFAVVTVINHYRPKDDSKREFTTRAQFRIDGDRKVSKATFDDIVAGKIGKGDFIRAAGQLHNTQYENKEGVKRYGTAIDLTSFNLLAKSKKQAEAAEQKEAPKAKKATSRKAAPKKENKPAKKTGLKA